MGDRENPIDMGTPGAGAVGETGGNAGEVDPGVPHAIGQDLGLEGNSGESGGLEADDIGGDIADGTGGAGSESGAIGEDITAGGSGVPGSLDAKDATDANVFDATDLAGDATDDTDL